jgi:hypothetical protein
MFIEEILPSVIAQKSTLHEQLIVESMKKGIQSVVMDGILSLVPKTLIDSPAFLDKLTNLWRYEFGIPYDIGKDLFWGTHMWVPVYCLLDSLLCAHSRLTEEQCIEYMKRLAIPGKHQSTLVEMIPGHKVDPEVQVRFEVPGLGIGNKTVDWVIGPFNDRTVRIDVKRRLIDFIKQAERISAESEAPEPDHDPSLIFRSVEEKFDTSDPDYFLQGAWIVTDIKQDERLLSTAFKNLNTNKVHFTIIGDWKSDAHVLVKRSEDEQFLRTLFHIQKSDRFTFTKNNG